MKIVILIGIWVMLNVLLISWIHLGRARQKQVEKANRLEEEKQYQKFAKNYKKFDRSGEESKWRQR